MRPELDWNKFKKKHKLEYNPKTKRWNKEFHNKLDTPIESPNHLQNVNLGFVLEPFKFPTCLWCGKPLSDPKQLKFRDSIDHKHDGKQQKYCSHTHYKLDGNLTREIKKKYHLPDEPLEILSWFIIKPSIYKTKNIDKDGIVYLKKIKNKLERKDMTLYIRGNWRCRKIPLTTKTRTVKANLISVQAC